MDKLKEIQSSSDKYLGVILEADKEGGLEVVQSSLRDYSSAPKPFNTEELIVQENRALALLAEFVQSKKGLYKKVVFDPMQAAFGNDIGVTTGDKPLPDT